MAASKCKCGSSNFEVQEFAPVNSKFKWCFVQCAKCGTILGVTDDQCVADMLEKQNAAIRAIAAKVGVQASL
jgi:hypothetical protein